MASITTAARLTLLDPFVANYSASKQRGYALNPFPFQLERFIVMGWELGCKLLHRYLPFHEVSPNLKEWVSISDIEHISGIDDLNPKSLTT